MKMEDVRRLTLGLPESAAVDKLVVICGGAWLTPAHPEAPGGTGDYSIEGFELTLFGPWARAGGQEGSNLTVFDPGTGRRWLYTGGDRAWTRLS